REPIRLVGHRGQPPYGLIKSGAFSSDGKRIATAALDGVRLWDTQGTNLGVREIENAVRIVFAPPNDDRIVIVTTGGGAYLSDTSGSKAPRLLSAHAARIAAAQFSRDGTRLMLAGTDGRVRLLGASGEESRVLRTSLASLSAAALSADG